MTNAILLVEVAELQSRLRKLATWQLGNPATERPSNRATLVYIEARR